MKDCQQKSFKLLYFPFMCCALHGLSLTSVCVPHLGIFIRVRLSIVRHLRSCPWERFPCYYHFSTLY